jgi:uracil-DNA glycosylase
VDLLTSIGCVSLPCGDVIHERHSPPWMAVAPEDISVALISEAVAADPSDWYAAGDGALYAATTLQAFRDAGENAGSMADLAQLGVYVTSAVKCAKVRYGLSAATINECSHLLERELALLPNVRSLLLMGDVAIKAVNAIARRNCEPRVIPAGSTYRIRGGEFRFRGARAFPSYLQAGPAFYIERSKREMIAEDIAAAMAHARSQV